MVNRKIGKDLCHRKKNHRKGSRCFKALKVLAGILIPIFFALFCLFPAKESSAFFIFPNRQVASPIYAPQELLVRFVDWASPGDIQSVLDLCGAKTKCRLHSTIPIFSVNLPLTVQVEAAAEFLQLLPLVRYAEPNFYLQGEFLPNDPIYIYQWHMGMINMETAWDIHNGAGAVVAVLDTGVAYRNALPYAQAPDLAGTAFVPGWDFVNDDAYPDDDHGHGTHITGTIAQTTNNLLGCAGIAYGCSIMPVKVLDENSNGLLEDVIAGIYFAVDNGAQIINTSFGTVTPSLTLEETVDYATLNKVTIICSAGNGASDAPHYPSSYPDCISVSAIKYDQTLAFYSNYGTDIDICAPGGSLAYDQNLDGKPDGIVQQTHNVVDLQAFDYYIFQGTSCAAAHVTGVAAMIVGASGGALGPDLIISTLASTAKDLGTVGWDQYFGAGLVDAAAALASLPAIATVASASSLQTIPAISSAFYGNFAPNYTTGLQIYIPNISWINPWSYSRNPTAWGASGINGSGFPYHSQTLFTGYPSYGSTANFGIVRQNPWYSTFPSFQPVWGRIIPSLSYSVSFWGSPFIYR